MHHQYLRRVEVQFRACLSTLLLPLVCILALGCSGNGRQEEDASGKAGLDKVTLMLNWYPESEHGGFYAAQVHGIYEQYGLDVEIQPGGPNAPVAQELLMGRVEFVIGNADDVLTFRQQDIPVVALMAPIQDTPRCILVHGDSSAKTLSDLGGMTLQAGNGRPFLEFMKAKGLLEGVQVVPYTGVPNFVNDPQSAMQGYNFSEPLVARQAGIEPRLLMLSEVGFNPYASCLITSEKNIQTKPGIIQRMVAASQEGWQKYLEAPEETNAVILEANGHGMTAEALEFGVQELGPLCINSEVTAADIGMMTQQRWSELVQQFEELNLLDESKVEVAQVFTTEYLSLSTPDAE